MDFPEGYGMWFRSADVDNLKAEVARLKAENETLWQMVDDFNEAVKKAAGKLQ